VLAPIQNLETQYLHEGENHEKRREPLEAAERYVDAIFNAKLKSMHDSPVVAEAERRIDNALMDVAL
jgi:hypothetical protein